MHVFAKALQLLGRPRPLTGALPLDPTGGLLSSKFPDYSPCIHPKYVTGGDVEAEHTQLKEDTSSTMAQLTEVTSVLEELQTLISDTFERLGCSQKTLEDVLGLNVEINVDNVIVYLGQIEMRANELLNILHYVNLKVR